MPPLPFKSSPILRVILNLKEINSMGLFSSFVRFLKTLFGIVEGRTHMASDALLTSSVENIKAQFRKAQVEIGENYSKLKDAIKSLIVVTENKKLELTASKERCIKLQIQMDACVQKAKDSSDPNLRSLYAKFSTEKKNEEAKLQPLANEIEVLQKQIDGYVSKLKEMETKIQKLKREESETVADIVSSKTITEVNSRLSSISTDETSKNLELVREARIHAKSEMKLLDHLVGQEEQEDNLMKELEASDSLSEFDSLVQASKEPKYIEFEVVK